MAKFVMQYPESIIKDFQKIYNNADYIFGKMTKAGAEVVRANAKASCPFDISDENIKLSVQYRTPTDDGINTKVYFKGYLPFSNPNRKYFYQRQGKNGVIYLTQLGVPVNFLAMMFEYGRSTAPFPKKPFFRKAFRKGAITEAMLKAQKEASGGLLE